MHKTGPIIQSLLDTDLQKFTMMQVVYHNFTEADVEYHFQCRTEGVDLVPYMAEIEEEIAAYCSLRFSDDDLEILARQRFLKNDFLQFLGLYQPRMMHVKVTRSATFSGAIDIVISGPWLFTIPFDVPVLAIVNEVYFRNTSDPVEQMRKGHTILMDKIIKAQENPAFETFRFNDFGTRRRYSRQWHAKVVDVLKGMMPVQFRGSSNVLLAHKYDLNVMGTMSHEYLQACQALGPHLRNFQSFAMDTWANEYQGDLGIPLTDTINMDAFLSDFNLKFCKLFDGMGHDSGDPFAWADKAINHYKANRIDPLTKQLVFTDKLTLSKALDIHQYVAGRAQPVFGIGTHLSNDVGVKTIDVVMKMTKCNGKSVAKISESPDKSMDHDPVFMAYLQSNFAV